jgi:branched-chain amino acid transport system permease protein
VAEAPEKFGGRQPSRVGRFLGSGGGGTLDSLPEPVRRLLLPAGVALFAFLYPTLLPYLNDIPLLGGLLPAVGTVVIMLVFTVMAIGLNVVVGYAGLLDLGYVAFYAAGAYTAAWFASQHFEEVSFHFGSVGIRGDLPGIHLSIFLVLIIAGCFTALVGIVIGLPTLRLRGDYLAIVTLGFGEIVPQFVRNADSIKGFDLTHGAFGIAPIDSPGFGETLNDTLGLPVNYQQSTSREEFYFYTAMVLLLLTVFISVRLRDSRLGRAWIAIREDETAAAAMGVPLMRTKTWSYAIGAFFGGIAGAYYASFRGGAFPSDFFFNLSIFILCMVILGGMGSVWGAIVGGLFLAYLDQEGLAKLGSELSEALNRPIDVPKYNFLVYGIIIVLVMLFRPTGLIAERRHKRELEEGVQDESLYGTQQSG